MLKVGITGGIGSGKSTVAGIFRLLGIPVYQSDQRAKHLMVASSNVRQALINLFGQDIYREDDSLNSPSLAQKVFNNPAKLAQLNAIVHPAVAQDFKAWLANQSDKPYVLKEAALIFEAGIQDQLDRVIVVWAPESVRIARVMERDSASEEAVRARMRNQWPDQKKVSASDFLIVNDGTHLLIRQVLEIHQLLLRESAGIPVD